MRFKLNIRNDDFPRPLPVFESWTEFEEDGYFEEGSVGAISFSRLISPSSRFAR